MERLNKNWGFSLLELIVVLLILGILATTTYFKWSKSPFDLYSQVAMLANDVRYAQNLSMSRNERFCLAITSTNTYQIQNSSGNPVANANNNTTATLMSGVTFGTPTNIISKITFNTTGIPYTDTASPVIPLTANAIIPLTANGQTTNVTIDPTTGRVTP